MDDILEKIQGVLSDEESMKQVQKIAEMLGIDENSPPPDFFSSGNNESSSENGFNTEDFDFSKLLMFKEIMDKANQKDTSTDLLIALRPLLKEESQEKVDKLLKIFKVINILPLLKESGLLGGDFLGFL